MTKTLAMLKMEKNFISVLEKSKPRKPYEEFSMVYLLRRLDVEIGELKQEIKHGSWEEAMNECADVSNFVDFIFEQLASKSIQI